MKKEAAINHYGSQTKLAEVLSISSSAVSYWGGIIPEKQAMRLALITKGELAYRPELYRPTETLAAV